jgi:hypothetical protein
MRIFLSYASEDVQATQKIAAALQAAGHSVFFDKTDLKSGREYDTSIRDEINGVDAYIFLISSNSITQGRYPLTELAFAEKRFPNPSGRVLPVMLESVEWARIPAYLTSVTILGLRGNGPAEVVAALAELRSRRYSFRQMVAAAAVSTVVAGLLAGGMAMLWPSSRHQDDVRVAGAGFSWSPERLQEVWITAPNVTVSKIEVRTFDPQLGKLKSWTMNKEVLIGGSGTWTLSDDFEIRRGDPQAFVDACFHVAGRDAGRPRAVGYLRALTWPQRETMFSFQPVDRATAAALSAKTGCDYVL